MPRDKTTVIRDFKGLDERLELGSAPNITSSLDNVIVRRGTVKGRKGLSLWDGISTAASATIIGLADFYAPTAATSSLLRMLTTKLEKWNSGTHVWDDVTGVALNGTTNDRPVFVTDSPNGFLTFINEGHDRPRKYTGSGNSVVLGGTPPFAKSLEVWQGFTFLGNISQDGTFSTSVDALTIEFSDLPDTSWDLCEANTLIMSESPGEIRSLIGYGQNLIVFKSDCIVQVRYVQGPVRFARQLLPFSLGLLASMSAKRCGEFGVIFLATDRNLYRTDGYRIEPLPLNIQKALQETMTAAKAPFVSAYVDVTHETYNLLYQRNSSTYFDGRLSYNYRTGEFYRAAYTGFEFTRALAYRQSNNTDSQLVVGASDNKVYEQENGTDDAGTAVSRVYDYDWHQLGTPGSKYFTGANLVFTRALNCQVRISVAADHINKFQYPRTYNLKGKFPGDDNSRVAYEIPSPIYGSWFKIRIEMLQFSGSSQVELLEFEPKIIPIHEAPQDVVKPTGNNPRS